MEISASRRCLQRKIVQMLERSQSVLQSYTYTASLQDWCSADNGSHTTLQQMCEQPCTPCERSICATKQPLRTFAPPRAHIWLWLLRGHSGTCWPPWTTVPRPRNRAPPIRPAPWSQRALVCPLFALSCQQQRSSVGRDAVSPGCSVAADRRDHRGVDGQLRSPEKGEAIDDDLQTAVVNLSEREKVHLLHSDVHGHSSACLSANPCRCALQSKPPRVPRPPPPNKLRVGGHESQVDGHIGRRTMTRGGVAGGA